MGHALDIGNGWYILDSPHLAHCQPDRRSARGPDGGADHGCRSILYLLFTDCPLLQPRIMSGALQRVYAAKRAPEIKDMGLSTDADPTQRAAYADCCVGCNS